jgi:hypothetical protein
MAKTKTELKRTLLALRHGVVRLVEGRQGAPADADADRDPGALGAHGVSRAWPRVRTTRRSSWPAT